MYHILYPYAETRMFDRNLDDNDFCSQFLNNFIRLDELDTNKVITLRELQNKLNKGPEEVFTTVLGSEALVRLTTDDEEERYDGLPWDDILEYYNKYYVEYLSED